MSNRQMFSFAAAFLLAAALIGSFFTVDQRQRAILFQFGEIHATDLAPGLHLKVPFAQTVKKFDGRILSLDTQTESFPTSDQKNVQVEYFVKWRIGDASAYYRATGGQEVIAADRLTALVNRALRDEFGAHTIRQIVSGERGAVMQTLEQSTAAKARELGIVIADVSIRRIDLPDEITESVYDRMRAEQQRVAAELRARGAEEAEKIRADADRQASAIEADTLRQVEKLRGEGDAKAAEIYAQAYGQDPEFYRLYRSLQIYRDTLNDRRDVLVLQPKSELFRYFGGVEGGR